MSSHWLRIAELSKSMGDQRLLSIPELLIGAGSCTVLTGRNGAGKTTLLRILSGLEPADHLVAELNGRVLEGRQARLQLRRDTIYVHQQPYLFDATVEDNVAYGLRRTGLARHHVRETVLRALERSGLAHLRSRNARRLSGGEKQRVALTRARVLAPRLLLLDEPTANLDHESREKTIGLIAQLAHDGIASMVTTHELSLATRLPGERMHLCKTGPCRYTIVRPFLYQRDPARALASSIQTLVNVEQERESMPRVKTPLPDWPDARGHVAGVVLAGGKAQRMGGEDKGLVTLAGRPMIAHVIDIVRPQVSALLVNANRNLERYQAFGVPVVSDMMGEYFGPLVGMASALQASEKELLVTVPCDAPMVVEDLVERLYLALARHDAEISVAHDGERTQPVFALLRRSTLPSLLAYLQAGGRKIDTWYAQHKVSPADFSDVSDSFANINTPEDREAFRPRLRSQSGKVRDEE